VAPPSYEQDSTEPGPTISIEELLACCLLGRIWGEPIPLPAIIHQTRNEWKFVKRHIEYVEMDNHWILIRFATTQDKMLVFL